MARLSLVILNYNSGPFLQKCLQSISAVEISNLEIIIVDNNSTDESREYLKKLVNGQWSMVNKKNQSFRVIFNDENIGFSAGNNVGLKKISKETDYVLFLNPDTVVYSGVFKKTINFLENHSKAGAVTGRLVMANGKMDEACHRGFPTPWRAFCYFIGLERLFPYSELFAGYTLGHKLKLDQPHEIDSGSGAFLLIRKELGERLNWWDEDYFWYGEDLDFCYRIKKAGYQIWFLPDVEITHYRGVSSGVKKNSQAITKAKRKTKLKAAQASTEAMRIFYHKHYLDKYPFVLSQLILSAIKLLESIRKLKIKIGLSF